jgi:O-methyltransferase
MRISSIPNKLLSTVGLMVVKKKRAVALQFPVEFSARDKSTFDYVRSNQLTMTSDERMYATTMACKHALANGINGDFVECGVWRGGNSILAADVFAVSDKAVWLFDTFAGMTAPTEHDVDFVGEASVKQFTKNQKADHNEWCYASLEEVRRNFSGCGLLTDKVHFMKGDVLETLAKTDALPDQIAVLRLDTDWYESTKIELEVLFPRLSYGGLLIIDDYGHWGGARKAVDEYFAGKTRLFFQYVDYTGRIAVKC